MEDFDKYVKWKLGIKINLILSEGKKTKGVISDRALTSLSNLVTEFVLYEIVTPTSMMFPTSIKKIDDDAIRYLDSRKYIRFELREFRNMKLKQLEI